MSLEEKFVELYEYIQGSVLNNPSFRLKINKKQKSTLSIFLSRVEDSSIDLWEYLLFQFSFKVITGTKFPVIPLNYIIGKNALKRWNERTTEQQYMTSKFVQSYKLRSPIKDESTKISERYFDEQRQKDFSSPRGYIRCLSFGGLFNEMKCKSCRYFYVCKTE